VSLSYPLRLFIVVLAYLSSRFLANWFVLIRPWSGRAKVTAIVDWICQWGFRLGLGELLRMAYYLLVPFVVLQLGWASPPDLGLANLDWIHGIGTTVALTLTVLAPMLWMWRRYGELVGRSSGSEAVGRWAEPWGWAATLRESMLMEASWALIRSAGLVALGVYWGPYAGLGLILVSVLVDPRALDALRDVGRREEPLLIAMIALVTATVFSVTGNLWLCFVAHAALRAGVLSFLSRPSRKLRAGQA
jgi:hypothetical protein